MYMVMLVLDVPNMLDAVLDAWHAADVRGATIAETTGVHRRRIKRPRVPAPYAIAQTGPASIEQGNYTVWAIVPDEQTVRRCLEAAEKVLGDLDGPDTGVLAAWPLAFVKGVPSTTATADAPEG